MSIETNIGTVSNRPPVYTPEEWEEMNKQLAAREAARQATAKRQAAEDHIKRETGELPLISDEELAATARRFGIK